MFLIFIIHFLVNRILSSIDNIAATLPLSNNSNRITKTRPKFGLEIQMVVSERFNGQILSVELNSDGQLDENSLSHGSTSPAGSIKLPNDLLKNVTGSARLVFGTLTEDSFFVQDTTTPRRSPRSIITSFDVYYTNGTEMTFTNLSTPVKLSFKVSEVSEVSENLLCAFWDEGIEMIVEFICLY